MEQIRRGRWFYQANEFTSYRTKKHFRSRSCAPSRQILKPADKKKFPYGSVGANRPVTPPRNTPAAQPKKGKK
uniref:Uncharacterized protein n=1 Tax=Heterorhabditis bacteriophora TaxID=37862 RepID=A0A1I7WY60_HETBA